MLTRIIFAAIVSLILIGNRTSSAEVVDRIEAVVNEEVITSVDIERELAAAIKEKTKSKEIKAAERESLRAQAIEKLVEKILVNQKIKQLSITVSEEEIRLAIEDVKKQNSFNDEQLSKALAAQGLSIEQYRIQIRDQLQRIKLMSQEVRSKIQVLDSEIAEYFEKNKDKFSEQEKYHARHIFFGLPKDVTPEAEKSIRSRVEAVLKKARAGEDFIKLAKENSEDPAAAADGGDLGTFKKEDMVTEIAEVIQSMAPGTISGIVKSSAGLHILKLEEKIPQKTKPLEDVRKQIEEQLYRQKSEERFNAWASDLKKGASIEIKK